MFLSRGCSFCCLVSEEWNQEIVPSTLPFDSSSKRNFTRQNLPVYSMHIFLMAVTPKDTVASALAVDWRDFAVDQSHSSRQDFALKFISMFPWRQREPESGRARNCHSCWQSPAPMPLDIAPTNTRRKGSLNMKHKRLVLTAEFSPCLSGCWHQMGWEEVNFWKLCEVKATQAIDSLADTCQF